LIKTVQQHNVIIAFTNLCPFEYTNINILTRGLLVTWENR